MCVCVCVGGGGVSMLHNTLHEQIYRAIRLFMFYERIINLVGVGGGGGGGVMKGARSVCVEFPPSSIPEIILEISGHI